MNWVGVKKDELFSIQKTKNKQMSGDGHATCR
jgi:hypothetical protein